MKYGIGIDIGGTKTSIVLGNARGHILEKRVIPTPHGKRIFQDLHVFSEIISEFIKKRKISRRQIRGTGIGIPGLYDEKKGCVLQSPNMVDWIGLPLKKYFNRTLPKPVSIENDANATAVAELLFGCAKKNKAFAYMTVSTGLGSGIILDRKLIRGITNTAGEVGHSIVNLNSAWINNVGVSGTLEASSSGLAIARAAKKQAHKSKRLSSLLKQKHLSAKEVKAAALKGDRIARNILIEAGFYLGIGLSNLIMTLNLEKIILGGGVLSDKGGDIIWKSMKQTIATHTWPEPRKACQIVKTKSLDKIADLGALSLVFEER